jgi:two-component system sensor histidine kinase RpfC
MKMFKQTPSSSSVVETPKNTTNHLQNVSNAKQYRHLIVDDAKTNRDLLKLYLETKALVIDAVENGNLALEKMQEHGIDGYDVVWTDLKMDGMSGAELTAAIRKLGFKKYVVVLTGNVTSDTQAECIAAGVDLICLKPMRKKALLELAVMQLY